MAEIASSFLLAMAEGSVKFTEKSKMLNFKRVKGIYSIIFNANIVIPKKEKGRQLRTQKKI